MRYAIPLVVFLIIAAFLASRLRGDYDPHIIPSALIGKAAPQFTLSQVRDPLKKFSPQQMRGKVWLLNVWASWCFACREEHPFLIELARRNEVLIYGLAWKDKREDSISVLEELGDPYVLSVSDFDGNIAIDYGVSGAPETYLIDKNGIIRYKEVGQLNPTNYQEKILPLINQLNK